MTVSTLGFILIFTLFVTSQCVCLKGHYKEDDKCVMCKNGTYMDMENSRQYCIDCISCDSLVNETEVKPCTPTQNRKCGCKPGFYKSKQYKSCVTCKDDTYMDLENSRQQCNDCTQCDSLGNETEVKPCTSTQNRVCGCKPGFYKINEYGDHFFCKLCESCQNCTECINCGEKCNQQNRFTTTTGVCRFGYFPNGGQCEECPKSGCTSETCKSFCNNKVLPLSPDPLLLSVLIIVVILGGLLCLLFIWFCRQRRHCWQAKNWLVGIQVQPEQPNDFNNPSTMVKNDSACNETTIKPFSGVPVNSCPQLLSNGDWQTVMTPLISKEDQKCGCNIWILHDQSQKISENCLNNADHFPMMQIPQKELWPAPVLYTIIREIPVLRWKEFLRLLSVSDDQIERIELESGPSYLEKQYMMLRLWSQSGRAKLENIYSALHYMNLSGCGEELQEKLEHLQLSKSEIFTPSFHA